MAEGDKPKDAPVTREELETALRHANYLISQLRDELLQLAAQVVVLEEHLADRGHADGDALLGELPEMVENVLVSDEADDPIRVEYSETVADKYAIESPPIPCEELLPICEARCCKLNFMLSTQDLEETVARFDYGRPYWNLQNDAGWCVHCQPGTHGCGIYENRPAPCRRFDCRGDARIWIDFDKRIIAPPSAMSDSDEMHTSEERRVELLDAVNARKRSMWVESSAFYSRFDEDDDEPGERG